MQHVGLCGIGGLACLLLAGCLSPLDQCLSEAGAQTREIRRELDTRRENLHYGYSIERITAPELVADVCVGAGGVTTICQRWSQEVREIRHPVDRTYEAERIALLERQLAREESRSAAAAAQCRVTYPAS